jgi:hypothetical protein
MCLPTFALLAYDASKHYEHRNSAIVCKHDFSSFLTLWFCIAGKLIDNCSTACTLQVRSMASDRGLTSVAPQVVNSSSSSSSDVADAKATAALDYMQFSYTADDA